MKKIINFKTNFKNFIKDKISNIIFKKNIQRWTKLPGGKERYKLESLIEKSDKECLEKYIYLSKFWKEERGWEYEKYKKNSQVKMSLKLEQVLVLMLILTLKMQILILVLISIRYKLNLLKEFISYFLNQMNQQHQIFFTNY